MSQNTATVERYLDGFRLGTTTRRSCRCLTDDIEWTVFGAFHLTGKQAYDEAIDGARLGRPAAARGRPHGRAGRRRDGGADSARRPATPARCCGLSMAEVFVMRGGLIAERRAWVIPLTENDHL